ncbi:MAG: hypothetical protein WA790_17605 [Sulfitobacter sp.]
MTSIEMDLPPKSSTHLGTIAKISKLAFPLMLGSVAAAGLHILKTTVLTYSGETEALFTLSMIQPAFILMLAFLESLAITNQVFSSRTVPNKTFGDIPRATRIYSIMGLVLVAILAASFYGGSFAAEAIWPEGRGLMPQMALFVLSMAPFLLFEMRNGALRGLGFTGQALMPFAVLILVDLAVTWVGVHHFGLGFNAVLLGNIVGPLVALPIVMAMLRAKTKDGAHSDSEAFKKSVIGLSIGVAIPVFASMVASSVTAAIIFPALAGLGENTASSFFIIVRLRILFIIPAIAIGSAIAILINQLPENGANDEKRSVLQTGVTGVIGLYLIATAVLFTLRFGIVSLIVPLEQQGLYLATIDLLIVLIATFALLAGSTMLQVILEHLRKGVQVLIITVVVELITIAVALWVISQNYGLSGLVWVMNGAAIISFILMLAIFVKLIKSMGGKDAV